MNKFPFFLDVKNPYFSPAELLLSFLKLDGHLGPFDCTEHAQEYDVKEPWLALIQLYLRSVERANIIPALVLSNEVNCEVNKGLIEDLLRRNFKLDLQLWGL